MSNIIKKDNEKNSTSENAHLKTEKQGRKEGFCIVPNDYCNCTVLILGSFPGKTSRAANFYYAHPGNRFWKVLSAIFSEQIGNEIAEKLVFLSKNRIALWDVAESAITEGSADTDLKQIKCVPLAKALKDTQITKVFCNGQKSYRLLIKNYPEIGKDAVLLPSTSPANAAVSLASLIEQWRNAIKSDGLAKNNLKNNYTEYARRVRS